MNPLLPISRREARDQPCPTMRQTGALRKVAGRWALATLVVCVALLAGTPVAAAVTTGISGTVTNSEPKPLIGIQVQVLNAATHEFVGFASTGAEGKYKVELAPGSYKVKFFDPLGTYAPQFYTEAFSFSTATAFSVVTGETKSGINAKLHEGAKIEGTVTGSTGTPLSNVIVTATNQEGESSANASTNSEGKYKLTGLAKGKYKVGFFPEESLNFVYQYYNGQSSFSTATEIEVVEPATTPGINAKLQEGGRISGTVTDAATHKPLAHVGVAAFSPPETFRFAVTNANGEYTIVGLPTGTYTVEFEQFTETEAPSEYINQTLTGVGVSQGSTTSGIGVALVPKKPNNTSAPIASGTPSGGQTLSCATGSWIGAPTLTYAYKWLRDGSAIAGATGSTYVIQSVDEGHGLACEVTATNSAGHGSATSNTLKVPPKVPPNSQFKSVGNPHVNETNGQIVVVGQFPAKGTATANGVVQQGATLARVERATAEAAKRKSKKCKRGFVKKHNKCVSNVPVLYGVSSLTIPTPGTYSIVITPGARVLSALKAGKRLNVTVSTTFQNAAGGPPVTHVQSVFARVKKKKPKGHKKH